ncbi:predicted protein [Postia placenta Mad-698-R]|nr:predicted protein [Postia placenta Mad-698-R]
MASSSAFTRGLPLAGPGRLSRTFSVAKLHTLAACEQTDAASPSSHRPTRAELEARLAHAQVRAQARGTTKPTRRGIGLGLPAELFAPQSCIIAAKTVTAHDLTPALALESTELETATFSPELALARLPSYQFHGRRSNAPPPSSDVSSGSVDSPTGTPQHSPIPVRKPRQPRHSYAPPASSFGAPPTKHGLIGLGIMISSTAPQQAFPGLRRPPTRIDIPRISGLLSPGLVVSPRELVQRNFPITPGAPLRREFAMQRAIPRTPGAPRIGTLPSDEGIPMFHLPAGLITPIGLGILIDPLGSPSSESEPESYFEA